MTTSSNTIYVRPGWASSVWNYAGTAAVAVAFDAASSLGQQLSRGGFQYSVDNGHTWKPYTAPLDGAGDFVPVAGTVWRFQDQTGSDGVTPNTFSGHYKMADGSVVTTQMAVIVDNSPAGVTNENDLVFSTLHAGDVVDTLTPIDTGAPTGGQWVIDSQSQPGLFAIAEGAATDTSARLVLANAAALPGSGLSATVDVHYYDRYQLDTAGHPIAGQGVVRTLTYNVEDGVSQGLSGFTDDLRLGDAAPGGEAANGDAPALAHLSTGGLVAVWQGRDTAGGGAGAGLWAQLRDATGAALGSAFALTPNGDARLEGEPAVTALAGGRFAVAYAMQDGGVEKIAYRVAAANGVAGTEHVLAGGVAGDLAMPAVTTLSDGSFAVAWRAGGAVHVQHVGADGNPVGGVQDFAALGSAFSPALAALGQGGYAVSWGEMNDGNVYAATSSAPAPFLVSGDGYAASVSTAAPLPHAAALAGGGFVITWDSYVNEPHGFTMSDIFFQRYDAAAHALGGAVQANVNATGGLFDAAVTGLADGGFLLAWQGGDNDGNGIFGRRFGADGAAVDAQDFGFNAQLAGDQSSPDVVALSGGGFAAAWLETAGDGSVSIEARVLPGAMSVAPGAGAAPAGSVVTTPPPAPDPAPTPAPALMPAPTPAPAPAPVANAPVYSAPVANSPAPGASAPSTPAATAPAAGTPAAGANGSASGALGPVAKLTGGGAADAMHMPAGASQLDGGGGIDTLLAGGARDASKIVKSVAGFTLTDASGNQASLVNVERIHFSDGDVALDLSGNAGQAYRLYRAAFDRAPDKVGLGYWIDTRDQGYALDDVASQFTNSAEFAKLYGAHTTDAQFVAALYQNTLHRVPDSSGYDYWLATLHNYSRGTVLTGFSESAENQAQVIGSIQNGIDYQHWG
jgi:hypothetical protein